ncbi:MAG: hypothetical protein WC783_00355 [Candidatus Paceibacterota bacterium]|jgi:hypothetical protein
MKIKKGTVKDLTKEEKAKLEEVLPGAAAWEFIYKSQSNDHAHTVSFANHLFEENKKLQEENRLLRAKLHRIMSISVGDIAFAIQNKDREL